jgi:hypothetical protein
MLFGMYIYIYRKLTMLYGLTMLFGMDELVYKRARACLSVSENTAGQNSKCALWTPLSNTPIHQSATKGPMSWLELVPT